MDTGYVQEVAENWELGWWHQHHMPPVELNIWRVFDLAYFIYWSSFLRVFPPIGNEDFDLQDPGFIIDYDYYYMPDEEINEFLEIYLDNVKGSDLDMESLTAEFNLFTVYIVFCKFRVKNR